MSDLIQAVAFGIAFLFVIVGASAFVGLIMMGLFSGDPMSMFMSALAIVTVASIAYQSTKGEDDE